MRKKAIKIPKNWDEIYYEDYLHILDYFQKWEKIKNENQNIEKIHRLVCELISSLSGFSLDVVLDLTTDQISLLFGSMNFLRVEIPLDPAGSFRINRKKYVFNGNQANWETGRFLDFQSLSKNEKTILEHLPELCAICYEEKSFWGKKKKYKTDDMLERAKLFEKSLPITILYPPILFLFAPKTN